jgi:hypothetical protein
MPPPAPTLDGFLGAVHQRWVIVRGLERVGLCVLTACAVGAVLVPILMWRGRPALPVALVVLGLGAACGLVLAVARRPSRFDAAAEADRQLDLADLLTTALAAGAGTSGAADLWAGAVLAMADARCRALSPNDVVLHRLGVRAWGGIGVATGLVLTLGLMSTTPADTRADRAARPDPARRDAAVAVDPSRDAPQHWTVSRPDAAPAGADPAGERPFRDPGPADPASDDPGAGAPDGGGETTVASDPSGQGGGASRTPNGDTGPAARPPGSADAVADRDPSHDAGRASAGGAGRASSGAPDGPAGSTAGADGSAPAVPPWSAPAWPADRAAAAEALRAGRVPDAYHDLVRDYFAADDAPGD